MRYVSPRYWNECHALKPWKEIESSGRRGTRRATTIVSAMKKVYGAASSRRRIWFAVKTIHAAMSAAVKTAKESANQACFRNGGNQSVVSPMRNVPATCRYICLLYTSEAAD